MAEILLSLTIIGVVAAITLPSLTGNINERTWNTQRKALYSRLSQAISLMPQIRGYGELSVGNATACYSFTASDAAEAFLTNGLSKVFKLNNICDRNNLGDCGLPSSLVILNGSKIDFVGGASWQTSLTWLHAGFREIGCGQPYAITTEPAAFETANGESVLVYYNPICRDSLTSMNNESFNMRPTSVLCANFVYDLNGKKGPNTVGKDVGFMSVFYPTENIVVSPIPQSKNASSSVVWTSASRTCTNQGDDYKLPNKEEMMAMIINHKFIDPAILEDGKLYATSSTSDDVQGRGSINNVWIYDGRGGWTMYSKGTKSSSYAVRCVKR